MKTNIKEVEAATGISKQNIRYYERQGLLAPVRNPENDYREYTDEDISRLQKIKLFRKLDMPIEEIRKLLDGSLSLEEALEQQKKRLAQEKERLSDALAFCGEIKEQNIITLDAERYLKKMEEREQSGSVFADFMSDFRKVVKAEGEREFSFMPDNACMTKEEFTESLFRYADENELELVITKESMYPEFTINGVAYTAERIFSRHGAIVNCRMQYPDEAIPEGMPKKRYKKLKILNGLIPITLLIAYFVITNAGNFLAGGMDWKVIAAVVLALAVIAAPYYIYFHNFK